MTYIGTTRIRPQLSTLYEQGSFDNDEKGEDMGLFIGLMDCPEKYFKAGRISCTYSLYLGVGAAALRHNGKK